MKKIFLYFLILNLAGLSADSIDYAAFETEANIAIEKNDFEKLSLLTNENPEMGKSFANRFFSQPNNSDKLTKDIESLRKSKKDFEDIATHMRYRRIFLNVATIGAAVVNALVAHGFYKAYFNYKGAKLTYDQQDQALRPQIRGFSDAINSVADNRLVPQSLIDQINQIDPNGYNQLTTYIGSQINFRGAERTFNNYKSWLIQSVCTSLFLFISRFVTDADKREAFAKGMVDLYTKKIEDKNKILELLNNLKTN